MTSRRDFLQIAAATAALVPTGWTRAFAQQRLTQDDLLAFEPMGNVTLVHLTDIHAQLRPVLFREPSTNLGVGEARGQVPHVTGRPYLDLYGIPGASALAYALTPEDYVALARSYGRMGGLDRVATVLDAIRAERGDKVLFLDGGDTWQNSYTSLVSKGQDMVDCMALLKPDAMTGHWEFTSAPSGSRRSWTGSAARSWARTSATPNGTSRPSRPRRCSSAAAPRSR